jgi:hypothetical protein
MKKFLLLAVIATTCGLCAAQTLDGIKLDLATPATVAIRHSMAQRSSRLSRFYEAGVIGVNRRGLLEIRDASNLRLAQRQIAEKLLDAENHDRDTLVLAIAETYKRMSDLPAVRDGWARRWEAEMKSGWWIQDERGNWMKKP